MAKDVLFFGFLLTFIGLCTIQQNIIKTGQKLFFYGMFRPKY